MRPALTWLLILVAAGCGRKPEPAPVAGTASPEVVVTNREAAAAGTPAAASATDLSAVLGELTQALRKYSFEHQRLPKTFDELTAAGYVRNAPAPPAGKKFGIDPKNVRVVVVKQ